MEKHNALSLEQRIMEVLKKYLPEHDEADVIQLCGFLTCECWSLINEIVNNWISLQVKQMTKGSRRPARTSDEQGGESL